ncbi:FecR domain-containing protein [Pelagibius sp. 7325]|uniref:FecR family protein n=1 Tax=Pelagibius sp. 7325 TaxID=3131994 RepID=UPI0030EB163F
MSIQQSTAEDRASQEATDWLILLQEDPDDSALRQRFEAWLAQSPVHRHAWATTEVTAEAIKAAPPAFADRWQPAVAARRKTAYVQATASTAPASAPSGHRPFKHRLFQRRRAALPFAALAAAACLLIAMLPDILILQQADYHTGTGESLTVQLADGSTVWLGPESAIAVDYDVASRGIRLLTGEAFFDVKANAERPFQVVAGPVRTTVVGTAFDVLRGDDSAKVAVERGIVRVDHTDSAPPVSERLTAGQTISVTWAGTASRGKSPATAVASWRHGQLIAQDRPMGEVIDALRRYYRGSIILTDGSLAGLPVTGIYNLSDPEEALRAVAEAHGAKVRQITPWVVVILSL